MDNKIDIYRPSTVYYSTSIFSLSPLTIEVRTAHNSYVMYKDVYMELLLQALSPVLTETGATSSLTINHYSTHIFAL